MLKKRLLASLLVVSLVVKMTGFNISVSAVELGQNANILSQFFRQLLLHRLYQMVLIYRGLEIHLWQQISKVSSPATQNLFLVNIAPRKYHFNPLISKTF
jgi:hypothetical protein